RGQDINQAIWSLAVAYHNNYQRELSDSLFLLLADVPEYAPQAFVGLAGNESCFPPSNYETIVELYSKALSLGAELDLVEWCRYAYALTRIGRRTDAESVMSQLSGYEDAAIYEYYWKTYRDDGLYEKALYECARTYQLSDSTVNSQLNQSLFKAETEYFGQEAEISEMKAKHIKTVWGLTIFLSFVALGLFVSELRRRNIRNQLRLEEADMIVNESFRLNKMLQQGNEELQCEIDSVRSKTYSLQRMLLGQYRSGFAEIAALVETPNADKIDNVAAKRYLSKVKELISEIESDGAGWSKFEARLNESFDGVIRKLRIDYPSLSEKRIKLFSFITIGFDATTCAVLLNEKQEYVRVMKSRLHQFLESNPTENTALYRMCLNEYK
ncbi:MAG: hypothetical protein KBS55_05675, partial [Bacteroidales bacterium]|nr:hypothetical protein [Candidatus Cryptobacteroides aphodequi]